MGSSPSDAITNVGKALATPFTLTFDAANAAICTAAGKTPRCITGEMYDGTFKLDLEKDTKNAFRTIG